MMEIMKDKYLKLEPIIDENSERIIINLDKDRFNSKIFEENTEETIGYLESDVGIHTSSYNL